MYPSSDNFDYSAFAAGQQFGRTMASLQQAPANPGLQPGSSVPDAFSAGQQMGANLKGGAQLAGNTLQAMQANYAAGLPLFAKNAAGIEAGADAAGAMASSAGAGAGVEGGAGAAGALASKL